MDYDTVVLSVLSTVRFLPQHCFWN